MRSSLKSFDLTINTDGTIQAMHTEGIEDLACTLGSRILASTRASMVEWENIGGKTGWVVRSVKDPTLALRFVDGHWRPRREGTPVSFHSREAAISEERKFFWELLEGREV